MENVTDDVWLEIFLHLPLDSVYRSKSVSKVWFSILSNPNFIHKWYELNKSSLPWVLFHFSEGEPPQDGVTRKFTIACPESHSQFIENHHNGFSLSFLHPSLLINQKKSSSILFIIGSSCGLLLCTNVYDEMNYYVCNPLTKKWVSLPPPPPRDIYWEVVIGFICCDDESFSESASFKVICVPKFEDAEKEFIVHMFSSDLGGWDVYHVSCPQNVAWNVSPDDNIATRNGVFYWFQKTSRSILALSVNGNTNECRLINMPERQMDCDIKLHHRLGESEGLLCYAIIKEREKTLSVWVLEEDWRFLYKDNKFDEVLAEMESLLPGEMGKIDLITRIQILCFNPADKNVVMLGYKKYIWAYNTRTKGYEQLSHPSFRPTGGSFSDLSVLTFALQPKPTILPPISW